MEPMAEARETGAGAEGTWLGNQPQPAPAPLPAARRAMTPSQQILGRRAGAGNQAAAGMPAAGRGAPTRPRSRRVSVELHAEGPGARAGPAAATERAVSGSGL